MKIAQKFAVVFLNGHEDEDAENLRLNEAPVHKV